MAITKWFADEIAGAKKDPMEIALAKVLVGVLGIATVCILWALVQELIVGHWWVSFLCLGLLAGVSFLMMRLVVVLIEWKGMRD